jgi:hypothetical protein
MILPMRIRKSKHDIIIKLITNMDWKSILLNLIKLSLKGAYGNITLSNHDLIRLIDLSHAN